MHFVTGNRRAPGVGARHLGKCFSGRQPCLHIKIVKPIRRTGRAFYAVRIGNPAAKHLIASANAHDLPAPPDMGGEIDIPALLPQVSEIGNGCLGAGENNQVRIARQRLTRRHHDEVHIRLGDQRVEIVEVGNMGQARNGNPDRPADRAALPVLERHGIFLGKVSHRRQIRQHAEGTVPGPPGNHGEAVVEQ